MTLFRFFWLRRFIRKNMTPIPENKAEKWKKRLSFMYLILTWNAFGCVCYMCYIGRSDWAKYHGLKSEIEANMPPGQSWAQTLGIKKATVLRVKGVVPEGSYDLLDGEIIKREDDSDKQPI